MNKIERPKRHSRFYYIVVVGMLQWGLLTATLFLSYCYLIGEHIDFEFIYINVL